MSISEASLTALAAAEPMRIDREWLTLGNHVIKVEGLSSITSQVGKEIAIIEGAIVDSDSMERGTPVKDMVSLSGEQAWRLESNMRYLRSMIEASLPASHKGKMNAQTIQEAFSSENSPSILTDSIVRVRVISKESKNGKPYTEKNWISLSDNEQAAYLAASESEITLQSQKASSERKTSSDTSESSNEPVTSTLDSDEDPEF